MFSNRSHSVGAKLQLAPNCFAYATNSISRWSYVLGALRIGKSILRGGGDWVVDAQDPFECGFVASKISNRFKIPLHIQIHTDFLSSYFASSSILNRIRVIVARIVLPRVNGIRVVSERVRSSLTASSLKLKAAVTVLPIFSDISNISAMTPSFDLKQKYPQWNFILLMVGRLSDEKNIVFALSVFKKLVVVYPKIGLVVVGDGPLKRNLVWRVWLSGLSKHVEFENWQGDVVSYYKTANIFLQTSLYEGFGLALLEAVASGLPAVSTDVGIAPELLNHKGHSFVCPVNDLDCFTKTISGLIENNQLRLFFSTQIAPGAVAPFVQEKLTYLALYKASIEGAQQAFLGQIFPVE